MPIVKPMPEREDNGLYKSPASNPFKIYSFKALYGRYPHTHHQWEHAYRIFIYNYDDYDSSKRTGIQYKDLDVPNSKSGTYVDRYSDASFSDEKVEYLETDLPTNKIYVIEYVLYSVRYSNQEQLVSQNIDEWTYTIAVVNNRLPLKKWTVTDVVNRILRLAEPLKIGQEPRFAFDGVTYDNRGNVDTGVGYAQGSQAEYYEKILAPEFAMPKMNLREQLKQVGGIINAEPRLIFKNEFTDGHSDSGCTVRVWSLQKKKELLFK